MGFHLVRANTEDFDSFAQQAKRWDLDFLQLDSGRFNAQLQMIDTGRAQIACAEFHRAHHQRGGVPRDYWTFALLEPGGPPAQWRHHSINSHMLMVQSPNSEIDVVSRPGYSVCTVSVDKSLLAEAADELQIDLEKVLGADSRLILGGASGVELLRKQIKGIFSAVLEQQTLGINEQGLDSHLISPVSLLPGEIVQIIEGLLPRLILQVLIKEDITELKEDKDASSRARIVRLILEAVNKDQSVNTTPLGLAKVAGVSERTVRYAFQDKFEVSPQRYLKIMRLRGLERDLRLADPRSATIADIASRWGFRHMSQLAVDYRNHFGTLPSETLEKGVGV